MTGQTRTAFVAAVCFVLMAVGLAFVPVPFVTQTPGQAYDVLATEGRPAITVTGADTYPTEGSLEFTTVSQTSATARLSLPEALLAYWLPYRDTLPREVVYPAGETPEQSEERQSLQMTSSQDGAVVAALRAADVEVVELPQISSVSAGGPSEGVLLPGDLVLSVEGNPVETYEDVVEIIQSAEVGGNMAFTVLREGTEQQAVVTTRGSNAEPDVPVIGVTIQTGYDYEPRVSFGIDPDIGGPSAGVIFSLAIYDQLTPGALVSGTVAGTGTIDAGGQVGPIGGAQQKIRGAHEAGATAFLVPRANCEELQGVDDLGLRVVPVESLADAVEAVQALPDPAAADALPRC